MNQSNAIKINRIVVLIMALLISALFLTMIRSFLMTILLAAIFAGLAMPIFNRFQNLFGRRRSLSAGLTLLVFLLIVMLPMIGLVAIVASQALALSGTAIPLIRGQLRNPAAVNGMLSSLPFYHDIESYSDLILQKAAEYIGRLGTMLFNGVSSFTYAAIYDLLLFFIFCYTMFFLLKDGRHLLERLLAALPLDEAIQQRLLGRFLSVTRATIKGTLVIAVLQGSLAGLAFQVVGIQSAVFWGTVMAVLSLIPLVGSPIVWIPAAIVLASSGQYLQAGGLVLFCSLVVGQIDNILRPILVGRDTRMHELFIFFGTLGGIGMFGAFGLIIGPVIAALFVTVWQIYTETFHESLADIRQGGPLSREKEWE